MSAGFQACCRARWEDGADAEVVGAARFGEEGLLDRLGRDAKDAVGPDGVADGAGLHVGLADVDAVRPDFDGDGDVVVDDEGHVAGGAKRLDFARLGDEGVAVEVLLPKLHEGRAAIDRLGDLVREALAGREPLSVRDGVEEEVFPRAVHTSRPCRGLRRQGWRWRR